MRIFQIESILPNAYRLMEILGKNTVRIILFSCEVATCISACFMESEKESLIKLLLKHLLRLWEVISM